MLEYCMCPKCERMIMLDPDFATGFCLYCGTHIAYEESREFLLEGLKSTLPDELRLEADLSELSCPGLSSIRTSAVSPNTCRAKSYAGNIVVIISGLSA